MREAAIRITTAVLGEDGDAASALACQLFDSVMGAEGVGVPAATVYDGPREGAIEATVRRVVGDVDGTDESLARFVGRVQQLVEREARLAASSTVERNVERAAKTKTGRRVRFARVPTSSVPCPWCAMLASRGFVYRSAESAEAGSHHHCTCTIVPGVKDSTRVAGYDTEHYADVWLNRERYEKPEAAEQQFVKPRDGERNHYSVDYDAVNSGTFTKAFDSLPYDHKARRGLRTESGKILREHDGTAKETLTAIDAKTGRPVADTRDHAAIDSAAYFSDEAKRKVAQNPNPVILLHNHPGSSMPSGADCVSVCTNPKAVGSVVVCHDGGVYNITPLRSDGIEEAYNGYCELGRMKGLSRKQSEAYASGKIIDANEEERWFEITHFPSKNSKS